MIFPVLEVTLAAADAAARRLTTAAKVKAALRKTGSTDDTLIESIIDRISAAAAGFCGLARAATGAVPTFGAETLRATWFADTAGRGSRLILPWRVPITAITSIVEAGDTLVEGTDYKLLGGGMVQRLDDDAPCDWSAEKIVAVYTAGWALPGSVPAEVEGAVIEQAKLAYLGTARDPGIKSETVPDVHQVQFNFAGGDAIGVSGLLVSVEAALSPFRNREL